MVATSSDMNTLLPQATSRAEARADERRNSARSRSFILVQPRDGTPSMWASDISLGGMQCRTNTTRWPGSYLDLSFTLPDTRETFEVGAQVLSLGKADDGQLMLGLRFCRIPAGAQMAIYRFLDRRRAMWFGESKADVEAPALPRQGRYLPAIVAMLGKPKPFAQLLCDAQRTLRNTQRQAAARRAPPTFGWLGRLNRLMAW